MSLAISNARNSRAAAMLEGVSSFSKELAPCVAENRVRSRSLLTIYRLLQQIAQQPDPALVSSPACPHPLGDRATEPGPKSWPS